MTKPLFTNKSLAHIQDHMAKNTMDWASSETRSREQKEWKTYPANGMSLVCGGYTADPKSLTGMIWFRFNDLDGMTHTVKFEPYWIPQDYVQCFQQAFMHMNELQGKNVWAGLPAAVKQVRINMVLPGRLPEED